MKKIIVFLFICLSFLMPTLVFAQNEAGYTSDLNKQLLATAGERGADFGEANDPRLIAAYIIKVVLGLLGLLFVIYTVYAGFILITSGGNEEKVTKARKTIIYTVIGIVIVLSSYSFTVFLERYLGWATTGQNDPYEDGIYIEPDYTMPVDPQGSSFHQEMPDGVW